ncbi:MAG TPA: hypothetical protein VGQ98_03385 [Gemmatimonadaceae bacterium]|nr:hypothetical protein [Gemmatimonadaceae bacterium]
MYSTCLFCKTALGANEAIEHFPVGRRLAFDAAKGRLWVVCRKCERWNLTPIEERWEAIKECERSYRGTKLRVSTDQIGLARLSEGLELIRIGKPLRPEFAAWRYGDQFGRRRRKNIVQMSALAVGIVAVPLVGPVLGVTFAGAGWNVFQVVNFSVSMFQERRIVARFPAPGGNLLLIRRKHVKETLMLPPIGRESWGLRIGHRKDRDPQVPWWRYDRDEETTVVRGEDAMRAAAQILPHLNRKGASARVVSDAVKLATENADPTAVFDAAARFVGNQRSWNEWGEVGKITKVPAEMRLALEMVSHEDSERRALEGELHVLEEAWKEAEEIAGISDDLFLPTEISTRLTELKRDVK